jgi:hypothetical protein
MKQFTEISLDEVSTYLTEEFDDLAPINAWGERSFFYNLNSLLPRGVYFCTLKEKDGDNDKASELDRDGIYRFNFGLPTNAFIEMFGAKPRRPEKGKIIAGNWNFTEPNKLMPHPVYGWMGWVAILNPTQDVFSKLKPHIRLSYEKAQQNFTKRLA